MVTDSPHPAIRQLIGQVDQLRRRGRPWPGHQQLGQLSVDAILYAIRSGADDTLRALIQLTQDSDNDAATLALWAVFPLFLAKLRSHSHRDQLLAEDFLAVGYAVLRDVDPDELPLGPKVVSRSIRRCLRPLERASCHEVSLDAAFEAMRPGGRWTAESYQLLRALLASQEEDEVGERAMARLSLRDLRDGVEDHLRRGTLSDSQWQLVLDARLGVGDPSEIAARHGLTRGSARSSIHRTVGKLRDLVA